MMYGCIVDIRDPGCPGSGKEKHMHMKLGFDPFIIRHEHGGSLWLKR